MSKPCIIRKVAFKTPEPKSRIVWGNVIAESEGLALVLVPKPEKHGSHTIYVAEENVTERCFQAVTPVRFSLESEAIRDAGEKLRMLGKSFREADIECRFRDRRDEW